MADIKSIGGNPIVLGMDGLDEDVLDVLDTKADIDGYYAQLTAGAADNLTGRGDATTAEFLYRTAGGTADIETGQAVAKSIKGRTLGWNQLNTNDGATATSNGLTATNNGDGSWTLSGTPNAQAGITLMNTTTLAAGHKILVKGCPIGGGNDTYFLYFFNSAVDFGNGGIRTIPTNTQGNLRFITKVGTSFDNVTIWPQFFDLTQMFGVGNEPSTVAEFEALFPEPYYEYDAGSLLSVNMEGVETVGFNQWDEEWERGSINWNNGEKESHSIRLRSANYIPVFPSTEYCFTGTSARIFFYDADKAFVDKRDWTNSTFTTPAGAHYMLFTTADAYGSTYNHDICINLSWSGRRNGEYEAFWKSQRLIDVETYFPDGMRSAGSVYDELTGTEAIQRVGAVDLGTLDWNSISTPSSSIFRSTISGLTPAVKFPPATQVLADAMLANYVQKTYEAISGSDDMCFAISPSSAARLVIIDKRYTDADAFKQAMSGVMLHYALATPIVTPIDPPLNLSYRVDDFGTERIMVPEDERSAPPVLDIAYGLNVVDFVRRAPSEYMSHASFQQFCIALQAKLGIVITETWNDTDNRYEYSIADTVTEG